MRDAVAKFGRFPILTYAQRRHYVIIVSVTLLPIWHDRPFRAA